MEDGLNLYSGTGGDFWMFFFSRLSFLFRSPSFRGGPVAQWVKHWPTHLAVPGSSPARGEIFSSVNGVQLHTIIIIRYNRCHIFNNKIRC